MSQHTTGPWSISGQLIVGPPEPYPNPKATPMGRRVVEVCWDWGGETGATGDLPWEVAKQNAALAAASPDLLEALEELTNRVDTVLHAGYVGHERIAKARAAIAKARGR